MDYITRLGRHFGSPHICSIGRSGFSFGHWPASDVGEHNSGYRVGGPADHPAAMNGLAIVTRPPASMLTSNGLSLIQRWAIRLFSSLSVMRFSVG
jgi:hypothetical protein